MDARWTLGQWTKRQDTGWEKAAPWYSAAAHSCQSLLSKGHKGLLQQNLKPVQVGKAMAKQWVGRRSILKGRERGVRGRPGTIALKDVSGGRGKTWQVLKKMGAAVSFWAVCFPHNLSQQCCSQSRRTRYKVLVGRDHACLGSHS